MVKSSCIALLIYTLTLPANAGGWYSGFKISQIQYSAEHDGAHAVFSGGTGNPNPDGCGDATRFFVQYTSANPQRDKALLSGVLLAYAADKTAKAYLSGCAAGIGGVTYPILQSFYSM